jgi:copper homeostasis protein CutC
MCKSNQDESEWSNIALDVFERGQLAEIYACVHIGVNRYIRKRKRLDHINSIDHVVELLSNSKKILVLSGAGVSYLQLHMLLENVS